MKGRDEEKDRKVEEKEQRGENGNKFGVGC